jgi:OOP family OmpA-OmpF porin
MHKAAAFAAVLAFGFSVAFADWSDPNVEGAREHPLLKFYPQASVGEYTAKDFDSVDIVTAYKRGAAEPVTKTSIEGRITTYHYQHKPNTSPLEIVRQYEAALKRVGFQTIAAGKGESLPGVEEVNAADGFGSFRLDRGGKPVAYVQVVAGENGGPDSVESRVVIAEPKAMDEKLQANADGWFDEISKSGRVAVYGINFDTGKSTLRPESEKVLQEIRALIARHPDLQLVVEGHTDNAGASAANRKLSEERAAAVKAWLVARGANASQLAVAGFGDAKPVGDNGTEAGRAKNRRVELVRRN